MIELLVSLAIIGMLFAAVLALTSGVREKARDAKRMSDVREISKALELYVVNTGNFPVETEAISITGDDTVSSVLEDELLISEVPTDPQYPTQVYTYQSDANGSTYTISFCLETDTIESFSQGCGNTITP